MVGSFPFFFPYPKKGSSSVNPNLLFLHLFLYSLMGRNLLLWLGENEAFLEIKRLNVFEIDYSAYSQSRRECRLSSRLCYCSFRFIRMG